MGQLMQLVALGRTVAIVPEALRDQPRHQDVACVPVIDATTTTVVLAWQQDSRSTAVAAGEAAAPLQRMPPEDGPKNSISAMATCLSWAVP
ncbi:type 2 periplasmic-binding domain-containing protein [Streptomyces litchfieldiae]|uniref:Uncharacterized protein n=1 Tax=Streptomyces litchfieldiae TaxID=3075543 RepID=A0ABU2MJ47_9ACTN|nr:hypothetical protein [Streptomyces sp. DSM 44938]MDT0341457.1 hypothetical protein [Streptomyces sp. DSM 44938]